MCKLLKSLRIFGFAGGILAAGVFALTALAQTDIARLGLIRSWAYQLQQIDAQEIRTSPYDLAVLDYGSADRNDEPFPRNTVEAMKRKPNGTRRFVLAYLSIGEAENYRYYWQAEWTKNRPEWLEAENPQWPGNFLVQYWHPDWQALILGSPQAYLDRIIAAGFDGVYLDGIDKFQKFKRRRNTAPYEMIDFVEKIANYGRRQNRDFLVVPQNGDELLIYPRMINAIDGYAREDLLYSEDVEGERNDPENISSSVDRLKLVTRTGKPVLVVEYPPSPQLGPELLAEIKEFGFIGYMATRSLNSLSAPTVGCGQRDCSR